MAGDQTLGPFSSAFLRPLTESSNGNGAAEIQAGIHMLSHTICTHMFSVTGSGFMCHSTSTQFPEWPFTVAFHFSAWFFSSLISFLFLWFFLTVVQCQPLERPNKATMVCAHPLADFAYGSSCKFECQTGYRVRGSDTLYCTGSGQWTAPLPTCEGRTCILEKRQGLPNVRAISSRV